MTAATLERAPVWTPIRDPKDILKDAIKLLKTRGWYQGYYFDWGPEGADMGVQASTGALCAIGAIQTAANGKAVSFSRSSEEVISIVQSLLLDEYESPSLVMWNDTKGRTAQEVIDLFQRAAG